MMRLPARADDLFADGGMVPRVSAGEPLPPLDRIASAPPQPVDALYDVQAPRLLRFFARRIGHEDAADLVHEAFASFIGAMARHGRPVERPEAYLSTIARNLIAKRARTAARRSVALHVSADDIQLASPCPEAQLEARDVLDRLEIAMARLRPMTREIFMAHRLDGYTYREIAEHTGVSVKRVEKHMSRAIAQLDDVLGPAR